MLNNQYGPNSELRLLMVCVLDCMCKVCSRVSEALLLALLTLTLTNNSSPDSKAFLRFIAPQQQYTVHCMHNGITLWAYLSEPLVKDGHKRLKFDGKATIPCAQVT